MSGGVLNTKDKNNLILAAALIAMIVVAAVSFNLSRALPLLYMFAIIEIVELVFTIPSVCGNYYSLFGIHAGAVRFIPFYNVIMVFEKPIAAATVALSAATAVLGYLAIGPMFWVTSDNVDFFSDIQYRSLGWAILAFILLSVVVGIGYISVYRDVLDMKEELTGGTASKAEFANFVLLLLPVARGFVLFNLSHVMKMLLAAGYEYGKDYTELEIEEEE